jgi:ketosteroid isomerase-like protein
MNDQPPSDYVREVLRRAYAAFNARDIEVVLSSMHQDVEWPNGMEGGYVYGHDSVRAYWTRQWGLIDPIVEPQAFGSEPDGRIVVEVRQRVLDKDGSTLSNGQVRHVYSIRDGLVRHMEIRDPGARLGPAANATYPSSAVLGPRREPCRVRRLQAAPPARLLDLRQGIQLPAWRDGRAVARTSWNPLKSKFGESLFSRHLVE